MIDRTATTPHPAGIRAFVARHGHRIPDHRLRDRLSSHGADCLAVHRVIPGGPLLDRLPFPPDEITGLMLTMFALLPSALFVTWAADDQGSSVCLSGSFAGGLASAGGSLFLQDCLC